MVRFAPLLAALMLLSSCDKLRSVMQSADDLSPQEQGKQHEDKARQLAAAGDDDGAIHEYELARANLSNDAALAGELGKLYAKKGNDAQAAMSLKRALELDGTNAEVRKELADVYLRQGQPKLAAATLSQADDNDVEAQVKLIRTLILTDRAQDALKTAEKLTTAHPESASALSVHAEALLATGSPDRAAELLDAAVKSAPEDVDVRLARARFLSRRNMHEQALAELERGNASLSERSDVVFARAHELVFLQRFAEAGKVMDAFAAAHPTDPEGQSTLAWVKLQAGDTDAARAAAEAVLEKRPNDPQALYVRARCLEALEENDRAIGAYSNVLEVSPGHTEALSRLWRLYEKDGQVTSAMTSLETLYLAGDAQDSEKLELARLYSETGFHSQRGLKILDSLPHAATEGVNVGEIRRKLQVNASHEHVSGGGGPVIMRGGH